MNDNRAIVHTAGRYNGSEQKCTRCQSVIYRRSWTDGNGWQEGATVVANHGHGCWSRIDPLELLNDAKYRRCAARGNQHVHPVFAGILNSLEAK